jgi:hypothetical protein
MQATHNFFHTLNEPYQSCLLFLRNFILESSGNISESWKFHTPFYYYRKKWIAFISYHPKTKIIYIAFVDGAKIFHPSLISEGRKKMKIIYIDPEKDIDVKALKVIIKEAISLKS